MRNQLTNTASRTMRVVLLTGMAMLATPPIPAQDPAAPATPLASRRALYVIDPQFGFVLSLPGAERFKMSRFFTTGDGIARTSE